MKFPGYWQHLSRWPAALTVAGGRCSTSVHFVLVLICGYEMLATILQEHKRSYPPQQAANNIHLCPLAHLK